MVGNNRLNKIFEENLDQKATQKLNSSSTMCVTIKINFIIEFK